MSGASAFGEMSADWIGKVVLTATARLPNNWFGLRLAIALRRLVTMRLPVNGSIDVERFGMRMRLHPRDNGCEKGVLFTPQMFEVPERTELFAEIDCATGRDFVFIDIGANVGMFSLLVASRAGRRADILAFEPDPQSLERLRFNVGLNPQMRIRVVPVALGEASCQLALHADLRDRGGTRTAPIEDSSHTADVVRVPCRLLLDVLLEHGISRVDALKIDVEGTEDRILVPFFEHADPSLWPRLIVIEDTHDLWRSDLFAFLAQRGYAVSSKSRLNVMLRRP